MNVGLDLELIKHTVDMEDGEDVAIGQGLRGATMFIA